MSTPVVGSLDDQVQFAAKGLAMTTEDVLLGNSVQTSGRRDSHLGKSEHHP